MRNCASAAAQASAPACTGDIAAPYGLAEVTDDTLLDKAIQPSGQGGTTFSQSPVNQV